MARPKTSLETFTSSELAVAADMTVRNMALLMEKDLSPEPIDDGGGKAGHRQFDDAALAHAALIGALVVAGFDLLVAARLAEAFAQDYHDSYGRLPSNLGVYLQSPFNPRPGWTPWETRDGERTVNLDSDFWLHERLRNRSTIYQRGVALDGDFLMEIADRRFVLTRRRGGESVPIFSPVTVGGLPAQPDYRIVGEGSSARIVAVTDELPSLHFRSDPEAAGRLRALEMEYLEGRKQAVVVIAINVSLAIRNAFDRVQDWRNAKSAA